jgi:hypothetical protein
MDLRANQNLLEKYDPMSHFSFSPSLCTTVWFTSCPSLSGVSSHASVQQQACA